MTEQSLPHLSHLVASEAWPALDMALLAYVQHLHNIQAPISHGTWALAAVQYYYPSTASHIPRAWLAQRQWGRLEPLRMRPPMPSRMVLALAVAAWTQMWRRSSLALLLAFQALLRPSEVAALRRQHILLPQDLSGNEQSLVICITQSKTTHRAARLQSVMVTDPVVVQLAQGLLHQDAASAPLVRGGLRELQRKFNYLREALQLDGSPFTLGTLRGGGAVWHIQQCQSIAMLQWRGRWASEKSVQHYLQLGLAATAFATLLPATRRLIDALADLAWCVLNPFYNGLLFAQVHDQSSLQEPRGELTTTPQREEHLQSFGERVAPTHGITRYPHAALQPVRQNTMKRGELARERFLQTALLDAASPHELALAKKWRDERSESSTEN
eukprot:6491601-Amphidinium_carterae.1